LNQCEKISVHGTKPASQPRNQNKHLGGDRKKEKDLFDLTNGLISFLIMLSGLASEGTHERKSMYRQRSDRGEQPERRARD
jgi:hypothetical protein